MTDMESYILRGKGLRELYDVMCEYPDGARVSQIKGRFPEINLSKLASMLDRMYAAGIMTKAREGCREYTWKLRWAP